MDSKVIVIDNGSYKCRVGYNDSTKPILEFRNLLAKPRKDKKKEISLTTTENVYQIGDEIDVDAMRLLIKNQFEKNVVTHPIYQEHILDYIFGKLLINNDCLDHSLLMTEPLANPSYCRQNMNELLFECYGVPSVSYAIDSVCSWQYNKQTAENNALIVSFGYRTTHVIPILNDHIQYEKVRRLNLGGYEMISFLYRLLQMKYPAHLNAITLTRVENIFHNHSSIALDYMNELVNWDNFDYYNNNVKKIQLPYVQTSSNTTISIEEKIKKRKELSKRLIEANQRRLKEKREKGLETSSTTNSTTPPRSRLLKICQPPPHIPLGDWLADIKRKQDELLEKKSIRNKKRQEMVKRHTLASQQRMRIISLLASNEKGNDEFGKDDKDWDVYKQISQDGEVDSDAENEKLAEYENILKYHQAYKDKQDDALENAAELHQLHVGVESIRAPELLFEPHMIGIGEAGLHELLNFVFNMFTTSEQQLLANDIYLTGGCVRLPGLKNRLVKELQEFRPFQSQFSIKEATNPSLDAWYGARNFANSPNYMDYATTKKDYEEKGKDYFKEHKIGNAYISSTKTFNQQN